MMGAKKREKNSKRRRRFTLARIAKIGTAGVTLQAGMHRTALRNEKKL